MKPEYVKFLRSDGRMHFSDLKHIGSSGQHYLQNLNSGKSTGSMRKGSTFHDLVLLEKEPIVFTDRRAGKKWKAFQLENIGNDIINVSEYETAMRMRDSLMMSNYDSAVFARELLSKCQNREKEILWDLAGVPWSSTIDAYGNGITLELKSTKCASKRKFLWDAKSMKYDGQLAVYNVAQGVDGNQFPAPWTQSYAIAVENVKPHIVAVYRVEELRLDAAYSNVVEMQQKWITCCETGIWGGYGKDCEIWDADLIIEEEEDSDDE